MSGALDLFSPAAREWFRATFASPTEVQERGWQAVASGRHTLMTAPTGSGKTLAAFLWCLDRLAAEPAPPSRERCRVLYVSPLKALAVDVERNLRAPLVGLRLQSERLGLPVPDIGVAIRSGDTPADERRSMERTPPDVLITTPESLYLLLTSAARRVLSTVRWVIVDELHSVAATQRGAHLAISLERLSAITREEPQRIGLSATQRPLEEVGRFLAGAGRQVEIVDAGRRKTMEVRVEVPVEDMANLDRGAPPPEPPSGPAAAWAGELPQPRRSIWPPGSTSWPRARAMPPRAARSCSPTTARSPASSGRWWRTGSSPATCAAWSPPPRWSWASTWAPSTWSSRWSRRRAWRPASSASAAPATPSARSRAGSSCPSSAATCWRAPRWSSGCWPARSRPRSSRPTRWTWSPSRWSRWRPWTSGRWTTWPPCSGAPTPSATSAAAPWRPCWTC